MDDAIKCFRLFLEKKSTCTCKRFYIDQAFLLCLKIHFLPITMYDKSIH